VTGAPAATATTSARRLEGAPFATEIRDRVASDVVAYVKDHGHPPGLAVVVSFPWRTDGGPLAERHGGTAPHQDDNWTTAGGHWPVGNQSPPVGSES